METLIIKATEDSPAITFDLNANILEIAGRSLPEDVNNFFEPVLGWLEKYSENPLPSTIFNFRLTYFNTASSKVILDILTRFEEMIEDGHKVLVKWHYPEKDEDMLEAGQEYAEMVDVPFEMVGNS